MLFRMIYDDKLAQAAYLIGCQRTGDALVIDPERDVDRYIDEAGREGLRITAIAETHIHADFLSGARELAERTGAMLYLSAEGGEEWSYRWLNSRKGGGSYLHHLLRHGDRFDVGNIRIEALHTPGHTPEHMSFLVTDMGGGGTEPMGIATGDFVFVGDVGRPDLLESAAGVKGAAEPAAHSLYDSLRRFHTLPDYLQVWPGHGAGSACGKSLGAVPQTTVGYEKLFNRSLRFARGERAAFVEEIIAGQPEPPPYFARMKRENCEGPEVLGQMPDPPLLAPDALEAASEDIVIVDTRSWTEFRDCHPRGALHAPLDRAFTTLVGSYVSPEQRVLLIVEHEDLREAVAALISIGLDRIEGYVAPAEYVLCAGGCERMEEIDAADLSAHAEGEGTMVLDVRSAAEYRAGHVPLAVNIAHTQLAAELSRLPASETVYVHCRAGARSAAATAYLRRRGIRAVNVRGGVERLELLTKRQ